MPLRLAAAALFLAATACVIETPSGVPGMPQTADGSPIDPGAAIEQANMLAASARLKRAEAAAHVYFAEMGTFDAFTPEAATQMHPQIAWNTSPTAVDGEISIRAAQGPVVLLVAGGGDGAVCATIDETQSATTTYGAQDAGSPAACSGGLPGL